VLERIVKALVKCDRYGVGFTLTVKLFTTVVILALDMWH
jgi:hypothetical protein